MAHMRGKEKCKKFGRTIKETDFMIDPGVEVRITLKIS
jgi:hypothetical protein